MTNTVSAKAGIHWLLHGHKMDSRLRGNDDIEDSGVTQFRNPNQVPVNRGARFAANALTPSR